MKRLVLMVRVCLMVLSLYSCKSSDAAWVDKVNTLEVGMTYEELVAIMGEPDADVTSGPATAMYILSDSHVIVLYLARDYTRDDDALCVVTEPEPITFDQFKEAYGYYPDDPNAWWND